MPTFNTSFVLKPCQHSWSHEVTSTLHISTEVMPILVFAMKLHQHFIRTEAVPTFMKPWKHSTLALTLASKLHQFFRGNIAQTSRVHCTVARHQDFRNANKTLKMQGVPIKTLKMQGNVNKTLKIREKWRQYFEDARVCYEDFEDVKTCHQEFWHCTNMPIEERWCNTDFRYIIYHHFGGSWRCLDFRDMMWNNTTQKGDDVVQISELGSGTG